MSTIQISNLESSSCKTLTEWPTQINKNINLKRQILKQKIIILLLPYFIMKYFWLTNNTYSIYLSDSLKNSTDSASFKKQNCTSTTRYPTQPCPPHPPVVPVTTNLVLIIPVLPKIIQFYCFRMYPWTIACLVFAWLRILYKWCHLICTLLRFAFLRHKKHEPWRKIWYNGLY